MGLLEKSAHILPPRAAQQFLATTSNSAATVDLRLIGTQTRAVDSDMLSRVDVGAQRKFIRVSAITTDVFVALGSTSASVGSITATTTGTNQANTAAPIPAGTYQDFDLEDEDIFLGYVTASAAGYIHIYINSNR